MYFLLAAVAIFDFIVFVAFRRLNAAVRDSGGGRRLVDRQKYILTMGLSRARVSGRQIVSQMTKVSTA